MGIAKWHNNGKIKNLVKPFITIKQKIHILNKPNIAYDYYVIPFSKLDIWKLDKLLRKLAKEICNIPKSTTNILTHRYVEDFNINTTPLLPNYIHCIDKQLLFALNDIGQSWLINQRLAKHITANINCMEWEDKCRKCCYDLIESQKQWLRNARCPKTFETFLEKFRRF